MEKQTEKIREIKFKIYDKHMRKVIEADCHGIFHTRFSKFVISGNGNVIDVYSLKQPSEMLVLQYTGLTDKNGKEIYEGDLISLGDEHWESDGTPDIKEIVFDEDSASFRIYDYMELQGSSLAEKWYLDDVIGDVDVIGNIHDNPELLKYL